MLTRTASNAIGGLAVILVSRAYGACVYLVSVKDDIVSSEPHLLQMQGGSDQTLNSPSTRAFGSSHGCQTCNSSQGGTIKIKARIEHLCAVLRLNNRPLMDQGRPCSMAYVCVKPRVPNSVNAPNN